jgi:hypothetical protein
MHYEKVQEREHIAHIAQSIVVVVGERRTDGGNQHEQQCVHSGVPEAYIQGTGHRTAYSLQRQCSVVCSNDSVQCGAAECGGAASGQWGVGVGGQRQPRRQGKATGGMLENVNV